MTTAEKAALHDRYRLPYALAPVADLLARTGPAPLQTLSYPQAHAQDWTAYFGAACAGIEAPDRTDPDFVAFEAINREVFEAFAMAGEFTIAYETRVTFGQPGGSFV